MNQVIDMKIEIPTMDWTQIGGDMNPGSYGGLIAKANGTAIELVQIQPTREYLSDEDAVEVGFPFWSKGAYYDLDDLSLRRFQVQAALRGCGVSPAALAVLLPFQRALVIAECLIQNGSGSDEGNSGFAKDVLGTIRVRWWGSKRARGWRYLEDEDREFRAMVRENQ